MNEKDETIVVDHSHETLSYGKYVVGFVGSVVVTLAAYLLATHQSYSKTFVMVSLAVLALVQFIVQMIFFLHVGSERKPRWRLAVMAMMLGVVLILIVGTLWIMNNLNYRMMESPDLMQKYLRSQDSL